MVAVAVNITTLPLLIFWLQAVPQLMPAGELVTVPAPVPVLLTVSTKAVSTADSDRPLRALTATISAAVIAPVVLRSN